MNSWNETPLFRLLVVFIAGILLAVYFPAPAFSYTAAVLVLQLSAFILYLLFRKKLFSYRNRWLAGGTSLLLTLSAGYAFTMLNREQENPSHFRNFSKVQMYAGFLSEPPEEKPASYKSILKIRRVRVDGSWKSAAGNCLVYLDKDPAASSLAYGDEILFTKNPEEVPKAQNPAQFDYKRWLAFNFIYDQVYLKKETWKRSAGDKGYWLKEVSLRLRDRLLAVFRQSGIAGQEYAVLSALILGRDDDIDMEVMNAYAVSGTLHVLSVSGLHVGIIYIALNFFLGFLDKGKGKGRVKALILILFLWFYALLTGLSPSVLRSATMLSFIVIGKLTGRHTNMYNTLGASAFFLLGFNPFLIMQVGFQLSYCAVLGILFMQPRIHSLLDFNGWLPRQVWSITSVSIAAQVATFPLGLFYFHQFPNYFLLSNLLVIPVSTVIIYGGILLLVVSWWKVLAAWVGICLGKTVYMMNAMVLFIEKLPLSVIGGISISVVETCLLYIILIAIFLLPIVRNAGCILASALAGITLMASQVRESVLQREQKQFVIYSVRKESVLNFIDGSANMIWADSVFTANRPGMLFQIYPYWWECGLREEESIKIDRQVQTGSAVEKRSAFIQFAGVRILRLDSRDQLRKGSTKVKLDYLVLSHNVKVGVPELKKYFEFRQLILDSSNSLSRATGWMKEAAALGVPVYSVLHSGAFVYHL